MAFANSLSDATPPTPEHALAVLVSLLADMAAEEWLADQETEEPAP